MEPKTIIKLEHHYKWKRLTDFLRTAGCALASYWLGVASPTLYYSRHALTILSKKIVPAVQARRVTLVGMKPLAASFTINNRIYAGLILVSMVAPLSACIHMLPGMKDVVSHEWFYQCWYNLFLVLGPYLFSLCIVVTAFLWIPPITKRIKYSQKDIKFQITRMLSIPAGLIIGKIVWLIFCDSNDDFERLGHWSFFAGGLIVGYLIMRILDYLVWRQEHGMNALIDSLDGIYKMDMDHEARQQMTAPYWQELRQFNSKY